jgi:hypothetical protein
MFEFCFVLFIFLYLKVEVDPGSKIRMIDWQSYSCLYLQHTNIHIMEEKNMLFKGWLYRMLDAHSQVNGCYLCLA